MYLNKKVLKMILWLDKIRSHTRCSVKYLDKWQHSYVVIVEIHQQSKTQEDNSPGQKTQ